MEILPFTRSIAAQICLKHSLVCQDSFCSSFSQFTAIIQDTYMIRDRLYQVHVMFDKQQGRPDLVTPPLKVTGKRLNFFLWNTRCWFVKQDEAWMEDQCTRYPYQLLYTKGKYFDNCIAIVL
jgi:hypothetical protein